MKNVLLSAAIAVCLCACAQEPSTPAAEARADNTRARGEAFEPVPRRSAQGPPPPVSLTRPDPALPERPSGEPSNTRAGLTLRIDASTSETLVASLQAAERTLSATDLDRLRAALTVVQMVMSRKLAALAVANPTSVNLSDQELLELAFGDIHNKTIEEVIAYGIRMTPVVAPTESAPTLPAGF